jgi:ribonuclease HII
VVAGVSIDSNGISKLTKLGVRDSKKLSAKRRELLYPKIAEVAERISCEFIPVEEIDEVVTHGRRLRKLNYLEAVYFAKVIDRLGASRVTVDAADIIPSRFGKDIMKNLTSRCTIMSRHKADRDFPLVSAASIVAKVERDRQVEALRREHGDFGSGYPSDETTREFFAERIRRGEPLPGYVRKSWKTWLNIEQTLISDF